MTELYGLRLELMQFAVFIYILLRPLYLRDGKLDRKVWMIMAGGIVLLWVIGSFFMNSPPFWHARWTDFRVFFTVMFGFAVLWASRRILLFKLLFHLFFIECYIWEMEIWLWIAFRFGYWNMLAGGLDPVLLPSVLYLVTVPIIIYMQDKYLIPVFFIEEHFEYWAKLWYVPAVFFFLFCSILVWDELATYRVFTFTEILLIHVVWTIGALFSCMLFLMILRERLLRACAQNDLYSASENLHRQKKEYERMQEIIEKTRKMRHDMRQHLLVLKNLAQNHDGKRFRDYMKDYASMPDMAQRFMLCDNFAVNALLQHYFSQAGQEGIKLKIKVDFPENLPVSENDLVSVMGNLLENALEACRRQTEGERFISVQGEVIHDTMVMFVVRNSYSGEILETEGHFISSKRKNGQFGIGLDSVRNFAEERGGMMKVTYENHVFEVYILLK